MWGVARNQVSGFTLPLNSRALQFGQLLGKKVKPDPLKLFKSVIFTG